ncbi:MAG: alpha/beta hydrolase-fold protein [Schaedlerella sp.]|nr:alpha/beta hydrolase-fold protein [Schaedlerella sp.]
MIVKRDFIYSPKGKSRPLHIYLPDDYEQSEEHYPVMYFFDGHNLFFNEDATYGKSWGLKEFLDTWSKPMIIVGIECGHENGERLSEYLPYPAEWGHFCEYKPMGDATLRWIIEEVKPMIDKEYRTHPFRVCTGIAGSSMGGIMALFGAVHYNQWFSKAACISTAMGFCMEGLMKDMSENIMDPDTRIYMSWGTNEAHGLEDREYEDTSSYTYKCHKRVEEKIKDTGAFVKLRCQVGGGHCEADWEKLVPEFMDFLWME